MYGLFPPFDYHNTVGINIDAQVFCECMYSLLLGIYLGVELLGHMVSMSDFYTAY